jgi:quinol monooxygenase YgiN
MYGLINKFRALPGRRDELAALMRPKPGETLAGCLSFIVAIDPADADLLWITEVWADAAAHKASLNLPGVQESIQVGMPLIAGFEFHAETAVLGGIGLVDAGA